MNETTTAEPAAIPAKRSHKKKTPTDGAKVETRGRKPKAASIIPMPVIKPPEAPEMPPVSAEAIELILLINSLSPAGLKMFRERTLTMAQVTQRECKDYKIPEREKALYNQLATLIINHLKK